MTSRGLCGGAWGVREEVSSGLCGAAWGVGVASRGSVGVWGGSGRRQAGGSVGGRGGSGRRQAGGSGGLRGGGGLASGRWSSAVSAQAVYLLCYIFSKTGCGTGTGRRLLKSLGSDNPNAGGRRRLPYEKMLASQRSDSGSVHLSSTAHGISAGICLVLISVSGAEIYNFILVPFASGELVGDLHGAPLRAGHPVG